MEKAVEIVGLSLLLRHLFIGIMVLSLPVEDEYTLLENRLKLLKNLEKLC